MNASERENIFRRWIKNYQSLIFKILHTYCDQHQDREDLFQEIALQLWRSVPNFQGKSKETTWIYRVALNVTLQWHRSENKRRNRQRSLDMGRGLLQVHAPQYSGKFEWLHSEIKKLGEIDRSLILLHLEGMSYQEMANILGISETNVGVKLNRIKNRLNNKAKEAR